MSKTVVADSTCLIGLSRTGRLDLLRELFQSILIPPAVYDEVVTSGGGRPGVAEVAASLPVIGTVAVLAKAEEKGLITDLNSALQELRQVGFYFPVN